MNKKLIIGLTIITMLLITACGTTGTTSTFESKAMEDNLKQANDQVGMPFIDNFYEKKMAKQIFELRDNADLVTYAYTVNLDGRYVYLGKTLGFGLPYSVQYTNPEKLVNRYGDTLTSSYEGFVLPQADPNGLYMPEGLSATWLMLINEETGEPEIIYAEPSIVVTQSKLPKRLVASWSLPEDY